MDFYLAAVLQALCFSPMALGIYITIKIFNFPDITTDGSYTLGAVVCGLCLSNGFPLWLAFPLIFLSGALAGMMTAYIHTKLKVNALLSGILVMTALYSVNLSLLGKSNMPLLEYNTVFSTYIVSNDSLNTLIIAGTWVLLLIFVLYYLLRTDFGLAMRATGSNDLMVRSLGVNTASMKVLGLAFTNGLIAFSGSLIAQFQGFVDVNMGIGIVISGLGSVMITETIVKVFQTNGILTGLLLVLVGVTIFQLVLAFTLSIGVDASLLKLLTSCFVLLIVAIPGRNWAKYLKR
ncbi:ABC transporter permease [Olivibacter sp. SDN3]|uniref:ABC transporter permease n=1 Tax=Olivibacter sp. SDN3 TaxID=2764720 RepID=UPI001650E7CA|nr:ABC transporter permease [Olivibacter sp. SDN3]QNL48513.1 ABC transporter permease [Olivibacter sp. SDN3]